MPDGKGWAAIASSCGLPADLTLGAGGLPLLPGLAGDALDLVHALVGDVPLVACPYATEAPYFQAVGIQTLVWGPGHLAQAHKADEYVDIEQLEACHAGLARLVGLLQR